MNSVFRLILAGIALSVARSQSFLPVGSDGASGISDLVLIYQGGTHRLLWTGEQLAPYVSFRDSSGGNERWLFDGFLFIEFKDNRGHEYAHGYGQKPARKQDWEFLLNRNFEPGVALHALDSVAGATASRLGQPLRERKVVLTIPEPIMSQTGWGVLGADTLDFNRLADRVRACRWYIDEAIGRWKAFAPRNLTLAGFYWVAEHSAESNEILPEVARLIRERGKRFFWIPYWNAAGAGQWKQSGFDAAYQQPNHFFHPEVPDTRLDEALAFARRNGMGMEMEFDQRAISSPGEFRPRLTAYLEHFKNHGALDSAAIAYYEGGGALLAMWQAKDPAVKKLYELVACVVAGRQQWADRLFRGN